MADVAVTAVINKAVDIAANQIVEESSRLKWLPEDIHWLERQMRHMRCYIRDAEAKRVSDPKVANFLKDIRELCYDVEDILDTYLPKIQSYKSSHGFLKRVVSILPYCLTCSDFAREIEKIKRRVQGIDEDRKNYGIEDVAHDDSNNNDQRSYQIVDPRTTTLYSDEPIVVGFDRDIEELKIKLLKLHEEGGSRVVSVVGMPGLGKTTLAKKVFKDVKDHFDCSAAVAISQQPNLRAILEDIAKQVGVGKDQREEDLERNLYSFLQQKRYILFLDDLWHTETWDRLKETFPNVGGNFEDDHPSGSIIVTSRDSGVGRYIGGERSLHELKPFDFPTSWDLFLRLMAHSQEFITLGLEEIGKTIVQRCGGVPLAIVVTVGLLRERETTILAWELVLKSMGTQDVAHDKCAEILTLSYMDLPPELKPCFLYLGLFPEDYAFRPSQLIRMWEAENFIRCTGDLKAEDMGQNFLNKLANRNLILGISRKWDGRISNFRMHDLLHSLSNKLAKEINFFHTTFDDLLETPTRVRRFSILEERSDFEDVPLNDYTLKLLRALFYFRRPDEFNQSGLADKVFMSRLLKVLILGFHDAITVPVLIPKGIGKWRQLKYLQVESNASTEMPSTIIDCKHLHTLDVERSLSIALPICIFRMKQLRHLLIGLMEWYVRYSVKEVSLPNIQSLVTPSSSYGGTINWPSKFTNLRKLKFGVHDVETFKLLVGQTPLSVKLENLHLRIELEAFGNGFPRPGLNLSQYDKVVKLKISGYTVNWKSVELPQPQYFPPNLLKLTLDFIGLEEDPMQVLKELPRLKILKLVGDAYKGTTLDCTGVGGFPCLEVLHLEELDTLRELIVLTCEGRNGIGMPKLRQVIVKDCPKLATIPKLFQPMLARD